MEKLKVALPILFLAVSATTLTTFNKNSNSSTPILPDLPSQSSSSQLSSPAEPPIDQNILYQASRALNQIAKKATPAVVSVAAVRSAESMTEAMSLPSDAVEGDQLALGVGSGVIIRSEGIILTNHHVVQDSQRVTVYLDEKTKLAASVIGVDPKTDLAVLKLNKKPKTALPTLSFGDSDQIHVGDWIVAVGNPFGLNQSVTSGIVSAVGRAELGMLDIEDFIQTDAAINPGNSGGPLLNSKGEMVGINTAIFSESGGFMGIGFSIPSRIAQQVYTDIMKNGRVIRGWMGITAQDLDSDLAGYFKSGLDKGALVSSIEPGGPAARATLKVGDIVTRVGADRITSSKQFKSLIAKTSVNSQLPIELQRQGETKVLQVTIREQPIPRPKGRAQLAGQVATQPKAPRFPNFGLSVQDIPNDFATLFGISRDSGALVVDVQVGSPAFDAGLARGDIILNANRVNVGDAAEFVRVARKLRDKDLTVLYVQRGPSERIFIPVKPNVG